jgi:hypothetical protein
LWFRLCNGSEDVVAQKMWWLRRCGGLEDVVTQTMLRLRRCYDSEGVCDSDDVYGLEDIAAQKM